MPTYFYTATSFQGEHVSGSREAKNEHDLRELLRRDGYVATSVHEESGRRKLRLDSLFASLRGVSLVDRLMLFRNLKVMVAAGVPLPRTLEILSAQARSRALKGALARVRERVLEGKGVAEAMEEFPRVFPELVVNMVRAGEESGTLEQVLDQLILQTERSHELRSRISGAMLYPLVIVLAMGGIGIMMMVTVVPQLDKTFSEFGIELPPVTSFIIALGNLLAERWYLVLAGLLALGFGIARLASSGPGKRALDTMLLKAPLIAPLVRRINGAFLSRTLSSLISSGVPIVEAIRITSRVLSNVHFREALMNASEEVQRGGKLSESLRKYDEFFPPTVVQMIEVGEETGQTSSILAKVAEFYEEEVAAQTKSISSLIEPILMLVIGGIVGFFAVSMLQPLYGMLQQIQ